MSATYLARLIRPQAARSCHDHVARAIGKDVLAGTYEPNTNLPTEAELMSRFQVSRTVIREVMKTLSAKGLVVLKTRVGTRALDPRHWNLFDRDLLSWRAEIGFDTAFCESLAEVRLAMEPAAAALAAMRRTPEELAHMRDCLERMGGEGHGHSSFADADVEFHLAVAAASGNPLMRSLSSVIEAALLATFAETSPLRNSEDHATTMAAHRAIVENIAACNPAGASAAMVRVIDIGRARLGRAPSGSGSSSSGH